MASAIAARGALSDKRHGQSVSSPPQWQVLRETRPTRAPQWLTACLKLLLSCWTLILNACFWIQGKGQLHDNLDFRDDLTSVSTECSVMSCQEEGGTGNIILEDSG